MRREQRKERPSLIQALFDSLGDPELRRKLLFVFAILVIFRFLAHIPVPGANPEALEAGLELGALGLMMNILVGGALANVSIVAMGVYPYITASIIMQLLIPVIPRLQALSKEGEAGRNKLNQYTHWLTVPLAMLQGYGMMMTFATGMFGGVLPLTTPPWPQADGDLLTTVAVVLSMTAGTMFLVWLGERINDYGIGNGISLIIFGGIVCLLPTNILKCYDGTVGAGQAWGFIVLLLLFLAITVLIVFVTEAERRIPVQYSRSVFRGGRAYRQTGGTHIPLKVNSAGMIPLIFAMVLIVLPGTIALWFAAGPNEPPNFANSVVNFFSPGGADAVLGGFPYWSIFFLLVVGFTFFYTMVIFEQQDISGTLQRQGGFIPGIRPGKPTAEHLNRVLNRITWGGALFLGLVAIVPVFSRFIVDTPGSSSLMIVSSAGLLIVVGVALDTMRQLEAQLLMRRYEGFLK